MAPTRVGSRSVGLAAVVVAALALVTLLTVSPTWTGSASELLLKAVLSSPSSTGQSAHAAHAAHRTAKAASAVQGAATKTPGSATPLFASAAIAAKAAASAPAKPSGKFLRHEVLSAGKAAVKVAALAKAAGNKAAAKENKANLVRARVAKMPLHTAMKIVEDGAANSLAQADKNAVDAALLRAALSVPGQRKAEKAAAAAAARAAANKPSAAWLAGEKSLADRDPYAAMKSSSSKQQQLRLQRGGNVQKLGRALVSLSRAKRAALGSRGRTALSHTGYTKDESDAYTVRAGKHPIALGGNDKIISTIRPNEDGEIERPNYNLPYVKTTNSLGTPVEPADVKAYWKHGHYHPYGIVKRDDRYVPVGRLLSHRGGVTRREMKMPNMAEEEDGGVDTEEEQEPEAEEEENDCQWGKDVYGRCYTECTPSKDDYSKCHDGSPIWHDPMPLSKLCKGHENATWCQEPEDEPQEEGGGEEEGKARTVQLASMGGMHGEELGGSDAMRNSPNAPTLAGGVPVAGGKVVWLPLDTLTKGAKGAEPYSPVPSRETSQEVNVVTVPTASAVTPQVPKWDPKKFSKEVLYGPNGKPMYAFYARGADDGAAKGAALGNAEGKQKLAHSHKESPSGLSETDKEIERKVLFKLLREEEQEAHELREQKLADESAGSRVAASWGVSLLVSLAAVAVPLVALH